MSAGLLHAQQDGKLGDALVPGHLDEFFRVLVETAERLGLGVDPLVHDDVVADHAAGQDSAVGIQDAAALGRKFDRCEPVLEGGLGHAPDVEALDEEELSADDQQERQHDAQAQPQPPGRARRFRLACLAGVLRHDVSLLLAWLVVRPAYCPGTFCAGAGTEPPWSSTAGAAGAGAAGAGTASAAVSAAAGAAAAAAGVRPCWRPCRRCGFAVRERLIDGGGRNNGELAGDGRGGDDGSGGVALHRGLGFARDGQGGEVDLALAGGRDHAQFGGLRRQVLRGVEVLHLLGQVLVLLRQGGLLAPQLHQLVLRGGNGDVQDQHGHEGHGEDAEAQHDERGAPFPRSRPDQRERSARFPGGTGAGGDPREGRGPSRLWQRGIC